MATVKYSRIIVDDAGWWTNYNTLMLMATVKYRQWHILYLADKMIVGDAVEWYRLQWMVTVKYSRMIVDDAGWWTDYSDVTGYGNRQTVTDIAFSR